MGKIKTKLVKRTASNLIKRDIDFTVSFEDNKKILRNTMPSKKIRNQIAGYIGKLKERENEKAKEKILRKSE